jgi:predicted acyl esterase
VTVVRRLVPLLAIAVLTSSAVWSTNLGASSRRAGAVTLDVIARGSVEQVAITGADPGARLELTNRGGRTVARGEADAAGALLLRDVAPGAGYRVAAADSGARSEPLRVLRADEHPAPSFYRTQRLDDGYQYLTTRDGTQLAVNVRLPGPVEEGPYPTVVEYSGYDPANPDGNQAGMRLAATLGYATVGVNMRGTGCSGGAWQYFEPLQALDGYDAIEVVAAQPWVAHGRVGMVGISYSGIAQLFVAATRPPHLAAITPLSVISDTYRGVLYPGGILNTGFAVSWAEDRQSDAEPAPGGGQRWATRRVAGGDVTCAVNQQLRAQTPNVLDEIRANAFYVADRLDRVTPSLFVDRISVPTFLAGAWQDEQTGGYWPGMIERFSPDIPLKVTMTNGTHSEPFGPDVITRWAEFLDFYVARRVPEIPADVRALAGAGYTALAGVPLELPPDRFAGETDYDAALARYEAEPPIRVLFDNGAGHPSPGAPVAGFEASFPRWPLPEARAQAWYLGADGRLTGRPPTSGDADAYRYDPDALPATDHPSSDDDFFDALPAYDWKPLPDGTAVAYATPPLRDDLVVLGPASADLWLRSSTTDTDLEVAITEVRPDGSETYVQSGWLRASHRKLDPDASTPLSPVPTHARSDAADLPPGRFSRVQVPIFPFGHVFRAGSRLRVVVQPPGGNRPRWAFDALPAHDEVVNEIDRTARHASRVLVSVVPDVSVTTDLPPCPALRGQPCRPYVPSSTGG